MTKLHFLGGMMALSCLLHRGTMAFDSPIEMLKEIIPGGSSGEEKKICFPGLDCLSLNFPWTSMIRPFPVPWGPEKILPTLALFTRKSSEPYKISLENPNWALGDSDFDPNRPVTVIITHGFANSGSEEWLSEMKEAYLNNEDANVFILDWGIGASLTNYLQVASNTRTVAALLSRYVRYLIDNGLKTEKIHLIGHSLGSHIMSYCAKNISEISKIKRITGLDPAQPGFEGTPKMVRLDPSDAEEVDVIHTDAKPFLGFFGFGMLSPVGTIDFYMNGGSSQPGCIQLTKPPNVTNIADLLKYRVETIAGWVACSHGRSIEYFLASIKEKNCTFWGRKMRATETFLKIGTLGSLKLADPIVKDLTSCSRDTCTVLGLDTFDYPARGSFAVSTSRKPPYCEVTGDKSMEWRQRLLSGFRGYLSNIAKSFSNVGKLFRFF